MPIQGSIVSDGDGPGLGYDAWCRLIGERPGLRRPPDRPGINPFTREPITLKPPPGSALIEVEGVEIGRAYWSRAEVGSPFEEGIVLYFDAAALPLVESWAEELGGRFRRDPPGDRGRDV